MSNQTVKFTNGSRFKTNVVYSNQNGNVSDELNKPLGDVKMQGGDPRQLQLQQGRTMGVSYLGIKE